ncbi:MAG TPA: GNAT family N-acetyltransferase [Bryobacteraceae bacterium]|nr:GNAT family N-acetyltransferase [Bryobacteraceae bacterium]
MIRIRKFEISDLDRILAIERASFGEDAWDEKLFSAFYRKCPDLFLVATVRRRVAGYIITCAGSRNAELASIAVDPRDRHHGVGQAMLNHALQELRALRVKAWWLMVSIENESAIRFYEQYGFGRQKVVKRYYGPGRSAWRMRRLTATAANSKTAPATTTSRNANRAR